MFLKALFPPSRNSEAVACRYSLRCFLNKIRRKTLPLMSFFNKVAEIRLLKSPLKLIMLTVNAVFLYKKHTEDIFFL